MLEPLPIERIAPPKPEEFYQLYVKKSKPVIIRGLVDAWPSLSNWNLDSLDKNYGEVLCGTVKLIKSECDFNPNQGSRLDFTPLRESITSIRNGVIDNGLAVASPVDIFPNALQEDYFIPEYCSNQKFLRTRLFIGPAQVITSLHQDLFENLYVIVDGKKRITLFAPSSPVYPHPRFSKLPNHSQIDIEKPDYNLFPGFKHAQPYVVDLAKGETLYLPSFWWHHLHNTDASIAVSFWWAAGWKLPIAWAASVYKKMRSI